ncbi:MAG: putative glycoside hydrolase [Acidimicrobiales bacterium]|jgi:hypothetical protein
MPTHRGAWLRYGDPLKDDEVRFAMDHYGVAVLQPWETEALGQIKEARPDMVVLCYKCLSSSREYENGSILSSGVGFVEAEEAGEHWFAHREDGTTRIEWDTYPEHWQMAVWDAEYCERWCDNVADELEGSLWDGVMADNDVYDDYYGLRPPIEGGRTMADIRQALEGLVISAGERLNGVDKLLVPNIAESHREPGRWSRHAAYGGGFEEVWLAHGPDDYFDPDTVLAQVDEVRGPGLTIMRVASDGSDEHRNFLYGLAAFWVFGGGEGGAITATDHDGYSATPFIEELDFDLGTPLEEPRQRGNAWSRAFTKGWAAVNLNSNLRRTVTLPVPKALGRVNGTAPWPANVKLAPHEGVLFVRP